MAKKIIKRVFRPLTPEERKRHVEIRAKVMQEFPPAPALEPADEPTVIVMSPATWAAFRHALDRPPRAISPVKRLLAGASVFDGPGQATAQSASEE